MPSPTLAIGNTLTAYLPLDDEWIGLGFTVVRWYVSLTEGGAYSEVGNPGTTLVAGQKDYQYNHTAGNVTDWFYYQVYGAVPGAGPQSDPMPVGPPRITRKQIRQDVGHALDILEIVTVASAAAATEFIANDLINADSSPHKFASHYVRPSSGAQVGNVRQARKYSATPANSGYDPVLGRVIVGRPWAAPLVLADEVEMWAPFRDRDPSTRIENAMQTARRYLWWEETYYLTTDDSVTDYFMPASLFNEAQVKAVEFAADTYPTRPNWRPVGWWQMVNDGNQGLMTILWDSLGNLGFNGGKVIRIIYNRIGDRMDAETDFWSVPLEWATIETQNQYLQGLLTLGLAGDAGAGVRGALAAIQDNIQSYRRIYMPSVQGKVRVAR